MQETNEKGIKGYAFISVIMFVTVSYNYDRLVFTLCGKNLTKNTFMGLAKTSSQKVLQAQEQ